MIGEKPICKGVKCSFDGVIEGCMKKLEIEPGRE
jgi:hypothetical protein